MLSLQEARNAYQVVDAMTKTQKLAILSIAGFVKTKYSEETLDQISRFLEPDKKKLNRLGLLVVVVLRQVNYAKKRREKRERTDKILRRFGAEKGRGDQEQSSGDRHLQEVDRWEDSE